jgi:acyl carrier protein
VAGNGSSLNGAAGGIPARLPGSTRRKLYQGMDSLENELKALIVSELNLQDVTPDEIKTDDPLFGEGLGLDSIDALELAMAVHKTYGVTIDPDDAEQRSVMGSVAALAEYVRSQLKNSPPLHDV